ncbi:GPI anchored protein [Diaporthe amygdali]|uniref:GPI anchored protein n=1 Tax=Phomopsis amygdali TaxID=1214568 RepID=UPI0022FDB9E6|nr:GPI anchored protein [Diaporthe amygdali]KAJ0120129.1 GPI anchored protein [Diaporthe amygdali]
MVTSPSHLKSASPNIYHGQFYGLEPNVTRIFGGAIDAVAVLRPEITITSPSCIACAGLAVRAWAVLNMQPFTLLARLPASLLLLVAAQVGKGSAEAQRLPTAIRKMSPDAGEKLLHEYYAFAQEEEVSQIGTQAQAAVLAKGVLEVEEEELLAANSSASISYRAPFAPHFDSRLATRGNEDGASGWHLFQRGRSVIARLEKRQFACPTGTSDCSAIGFPNSCCQAGTECVQITDTGLGPYWMCPECDRYGDRCDAHKHHDLDDQRLSNHNRGHPYRSSVFICKHNKNEHQDKLKFDFYERDLHNCQLDVSNVNRDVLCSRSACPPNLDQHLDHAPRLLPHGILCMLGRLRWRLLPDRPRLPRDFVPVYSIHHHYLWRRDSSRACDGGPYHHLDGDMCRRLVPVPFGRGRHCSATASVAKELPGNSEIFGLRKAQECGVRNSSSR